MPVNILNLPRLRVSDFKETDTEYHVSAETAVMSRVCPYCQQAHDTVIHVRRTPVIRDIPSHGKAVALCDDWPLPGSEIPLTALRQ